jgi:hypothetical protein
MIEGVAMVHSIIDTSSSSTIALLFRLDEPWALDLALRFPLAEADNGGGASPEDVGRREGEPGGDTDGLGVMAFWVPGNSVLVECVSDLTAAALVTESSGRTCSFRRTSW